MKAAASHMGAQDAKESWKPVSPPPSKKLTNMAGQQVTAEAQQIASGSLYTARYHRPVERVRAFLAVRRST